MRGFVEDIEELTEKNTVFRRVLYTAKNMQLVLMALSPARKSAKKCMTTEISSFAWRKDMAKFGLTVA